MMEMLHYADELREPAEYYDEVPSAKPDKEMVDLAVQLIEKKSSACDRTALKQLVQEKLKGHKIIAHHEERPQSGNVVDLMKALKRSLKGGTASAPPAKSSGKRAEAEASPSKKRSTKAG
jgi:DNA end-binding protein Ku